MRRLTSLGSGFGANFAMTSGGMLSLPCPAYPVAFAVADAAGAGPGGGAGLAVAAVVGGFGGSAAGPHPSDPMRTSTEGEDQTKTRFMGPAYQGHGPTARAALA